MTRNSGWLPTDYKALRCILIGWVLESENCRGFKWVSDNPKQFIEGEEFIEGTGHADFSKIEQPLFVGGRTSTPLEQAITRVSYLLKDEIFYGDSLRHFFGGGFQIIYHKGDKFEMLPSITYVSLEMEETSTQGTLGIPLPQRILKYQFYNRVVEAMTAIIDEESISQGSTPNKAVNLEMHYIYPVTAKSHDRWQVHVSLPFQSEYYCICLDITLRNLAELPIDAKTIRLDWIFIAPDHQKSDYIQIENRDTTEHMQLTQQFLQNLETALLSIDR